MHPGWCTWWRFPLCNLIGLFNISMHSDWLMTLYHCVPIGWSHHSISRFKIDHRLAVRIYIATPPQYNHCFSIQQCKCFVYFLWFFVFLFFNLFCSFIHGHDAFVTQPVQNNAGIAGGPPLGFYFVQNVSQLAMSCALCVVSKDVDRRLW